jgi:hemerythrin HHE cation binding domain-containing protein
MSIIDKVIAAVTPPESEDARREARAKALASAMPGDWLSMVLTHHQHIEAAFTAVESADNVDARVAAQKKLSIILTGHANAEETVLYPALAAVDEKSHATMAYEEQAAAKTQLALLETIPPMTQEYLDKLEHIRGAVSHHMYEEENGWFIELRQKALAAEQHRLSQRYREEFIRYVGTNLDDDLVHLRVPSESAAADVRMPEMR